MSFSRLPPLNATLSTLAQSPALLDEILSHSPRHTHDTVASYLLTIFIVWHLLSCFSPMTLPHLQPL